MFSIHGLFGASTALDGTHRCDHATLSRRRRGGVRFCMLSWFKVPGRMDSGRYPERFNAFFSFLFLISGIHRIMRKVVVLAAVLAALTPAIGEALAAETAGETSERCREGDVVCLDTVQVTATKRPESTLHIPAATTIVGGRRLRETAPQTPMDALHGEVGTFVQQTTPGQGVVIVRGLKGSEVLHLVDGFRLNNSIFRNAPNQYIALVDGQSLDRIEVVRGPSSTLYGGDAMGGVVQMLTPNWISKAMHGSGTAGCARSPRAPTIR